MSKVVLRSEQRRVPVHRWLRVPAPGRALGILLLVGVIALLRPFGPGTGRVPWLGPEPPPELADAARMLGQLLLCVAAVVALRREGVRSALRELGLAGGPARGALLGLASTIPLLAGFAIGGGPRSIITVGGLLSGAVAVPLSEEILFRGLLFRHLHQRLRWRFWPAALTAGGVYAFTYLGQARHAGFGPLGTSALLCVALAFSCFSAWLFVRWGWDLWMAIGFHASANLWGVLFYAGDTLLGQGPALPTVLVGGAIAVGLSLLGTRERDPVRLHEARRRRSAVRTPFRSRTPEATFPAEPERERS